MALYTITTGEQGAILPVIATAFASEHILERSHLQPLIRDNIDVIAPDTLIVAGELSIWENSERRIDLLGIDKDANLVVFELKRDDTGGHMELQALRYAAMVSPLTFSQVVDEFARFQIKNGKSENARQTLLDFLNWETEGEKPFDTDVRIVLTSADFHAEIGTTASWLNSKGVDIRCVRMKPYKIDARVIVDIQQVIPPLDGGYTIRINTKAEGEKAIAKATNRDYTRFNLTIGDDTWANLTKRGVIFACIKQLCSLGITPIEIKNVWVGLGMSSEEANSRWASTDGELKSDEFKAAITNQRSGTKTPHDSSRYFGKDDELIYSDGKTYAVSNQWGGRDGLVTLLNGLRSAFQSRLDITITFDEIQPKGSI